MGIFLKIYKYREYNNRTVHHCFTKTIDTRKLLQIIYTLCMYKIMVYDINKIKVHHFENRNNFISDLSYNIICYTYIDI